MSHVIKRYDDAEIVGEWATIDMATGCQLDGGKLLARTVKFRGDDGGVRLEREWFPDRIPETQDGEGWKGQ